LVPKPVCIWTPEPFEQSANSYTRRAKIKNLAKRSIETGEDCEAIPESMRKYLAMQAMESGKPFNREFAQLGGMNEFSSGLFMDSPASKIGKHCEPYSPSPINAP